MKKSDVLFGSRPVSVWLVTAHGRQAIEPEGDETVFSLLDRCSIPWSSVSIYARGRTDDRLHLVACLGKRLSELDEWDSLFIYLNRNVNPFQFNVSDFHVAPSEYPGQEVSEYFYQKFDNQNSSVSSVLKMLSPDECRAVIRSRVVDTLDRHLPDGSKIVIGVSGGGDSNALLDALCADSKYRARIYPVILRGIPEWDKGVPRAQEICAKYDLDLKVFTEVDVKNFLGFSDNSISLAERFSHFFPDDDFEFLGTLLIRLGLSSYAKEIGTSFIATGVNLEDILCEAIFRLTSGMRPAPFPSRKIGNSTLLFPMWLCPKRIIDGCFPKYSRENYDARYPCVSLGRNLYYSVVFALQSKFPGFAEQFASGLSTQSMTDPVQYTFDPILGFHIEREVPFELRHRFLRMIGRPGTVQ